MEAVRLQADAALRRARRRLRAASERARVAIASKVGMGRRSFGVALTVVGQTSADSELKRAEKVLTKRQSTLLSIQSCQQTAWRSIQHLTASARLVREDEEKTLNRVQQLSQEVVLTS